MNVLWQDNVPSFLDDSSLAGAGGFAASLGDGGAPWFASADGGLFSGQSVLWWDNGADSATAASGLTGVAGFDLGGAAGGWLPHGAEAFAGTNPALDGGLLWPRDSGSTSNLVLTSPGVGQFDLTAGSGGPSQWQRVGQFDLTAGSGGPSQWQQLLGGHAAGFPEATSLLWTGGSDQAPVTLPIVDNAPLANPTSLDNVAVHPFSMLAPQQLVWTDPSTLVGGQPGLATAAPDNSPGGPFLDNAGASARVLSGNASSGR